MDTDVASLRARTMRVPRRHMGGHIFFQPWGDIGRVVVATAITFALIVATVAVSRGVTIADGVAALLALIGLQEIMRWAQSRFLPVHHAVRQPPLVFVWDGVLLEDRLPEHRVSADEVRAAIRKAGVSSVSDVQIVVLENDGDWSVIRKSDHRADDSAFLGLPIPDRPGNSRSGSGHEADPAPADRLP